MKISNWKQVEQKTWLNRQETTRTNDVLPGPTHLKSAEFIITISCVIIVTYFLLSNSFLTFSRIFLVNSVKEKF